MYFQIKMVIFVDMTTNTLLTVDYFDLFYIFFYIKYIYKCVFAVIKLNLSRNGYQLHI